MPSRLEQNWGVKGSRMFSRYVKSGIHGFWADDPKVRSPGKGDDMKKWLNTRKKVWQ